MNSFDLSFLKYLQEHSPVYVEDAVQQFGKTLSTLKRTMKEINEQLDPAFHLHVENQSIVTAMGYREYVSFLENIHFNRYLTSPEERVRDLTVALCLQNIVNKSDYYQKFHVSPGTLKNDNQALVTFLQANKLAVQSVHRQGSRLQGDEISLRIAICLTILKTVEIGEDNQLVQHSANEPINRSIACQFLQQCEREIREAADIYCQRIAPRLTLGYNGKKYFLVYMSIALQRTGRGHCITDTHALDFVTAMDFSLLASPAENRFLDLLLSSLSFTWRPFTLYDVPLIDKVQRFSQAIAPFLQATINNQQAWFGEVYQFIYTAIVQNKFSLWFEDKKLHHVREHYPALYQGVCVEVREIEQAWAVNFSPVHIATLVLILKKYELQNRLHDEVKKRVVIVTNSSESKVGYFKEVLKSWFHIDIVASVNINEIHQLQDIPFDLLLTFTNKISSYLRYYQYDYVKVSFHLTQEDISTLRQMGLSRAKKKIAIETFIEESRNLADSELRQYLEARYPEIFI